MLSHRILIYSEKLLLLMMEAKVIENDESTIMKIKQAKNELIGNNKIKIQYFESGLLHE
jgi:hypothetical protein